MPKIRRFEMYRGILGWLLLVVAFMLNYAHRLTLATVGSQVMNDLAIGASALGLLSSIYFYAYGGATIPAGILVDRYGAHKPATIGLLIAGGGCLIFALATGFTAGLAGRFMLATGLAVILPAIIKVQQEWFPRRQFATLTGLTSAAASLSALLALGAIVLVVDAFGWRFTVAGLAFLTLATGMLVWLVVRDRPARRERESESDSKKNSASHLRMQFASVLRDARLWPPLFAGLGNYGGFIALVGVWGVPYMSVAYGLDPIAATAYVQILLIGMVVGSPFLGWISDRIGNRRMPYLIATLPVLGTWIWLTLSVPPIEVLPFLFFSTGVGVSASSLGVSLTMELFPPHQVSLATSLVNAGGTFGGALSQPAMGLILQHYGLTLSGFQNAFLVGLGGALLCLAMTLVFATPSHALHEVWN